MYVSTFWLFGVEPYTESLFQKMFLLSGGDYRVAVAKGTQLPSHTSVTLELFYIQPLLFLVPFAVVTFVSLEHGLFFFASAVLWHCVLGCLQYSTHLSGTSAVVSTQLLKQVSKPLWGHCGDYR